MQKKATRKVFIFGGGGGSCRTFLRFKERLQRLCEGRNKPKVKPFLWMLDEQHRKQGSDWQEAQEGPREKRLHTVHQPAELTATRGAMAAEGDRPSRAYRQPLMADMQASDLQRLCESPLQGKGGETQFINPRLHLGTSNG